MPGLCLCSTLHWFLRPSLRHTALLVLDNLNSVVVLCSTESVSVTNSWSLTPLPCSFGNVSPLTQTFFMLFFFLLLACSACLHLPSAVLFAQLSLCTAVELHLLNLQWGISKIYLIQGFHINRACSIFHCHLNTGVRKLHGQTRYSIFGMPQPGV